MYGWPAVDWDALRAGRSGKIAELMRRRRLDHLLLTGFDTIRYAADYRTLIIAEGFDWFAAIVDQDGACDVFVPWVDEVDVRPEPGLPWVRSVRPLPSWSPALAHARTWTQSIAGVLRQHGAKSVGFDLVYADLLAALRQQVPHVEFVPVATELLDLRLRKDPIEIELLAAASQVNSLAAAAALEAAKAGMTDHDILAVAMECLQRAGAEFVSHSVCNVRRGSGTWFAAGNELAEADAYFFDIGCYGSGGYASDMARTGFVGEPLPEVRRAYRALLEAHDLAAERARPGTRASEVHEAANQYLRRQGLPITPYAIGHGVGLRACELPTIYRADRMDRDQVLEEGMVIALEPETAVQAAGRVVVLKVEDNYVVQRDGLRRLTNAPYGRDPRPAPGS
jgi:Xaa-Pro dipeptidase